MDGKLAVDFMDGGSCSDVNGCVGVRSASADSTRPCVCYGSTRAAAATEHREE
jgi:hypothetical protein